MHHSLRRIFMILVVAGLLPACASSNSAPPPSPLPPLARLAFLADNDGTLESFTVATLTGQLSPQGFSAAYTGAAPGAGQVAAVNPAGSLAWVLTTGGTPSLSTYLVNSTNGQLSSVTVQVAPVGGLTSATGIAVDPGGGVVYIMGGTGAGPTGAVQAFAVTSNGTLTALGTPVSTGTALASPSAMAVSPHGGILYVANFDLGTIAGFFLSGGQLVATPIAVTGTNPNGLAFDPTGTYLFALTQAAAQVWAYTIVSGTLALSTVAGSPFSSGVSTPTILATEPLNRFVWVGNALGTFATLDLDVSTGFLSAPPGNTSTLGVATTALTVDPSGLFGFIPVVGGTVLAADVSPTGLLGTSSVLSTRTRGTSPTAVVTVTADAPVIRTPSFLYVGSALGINAYEITAITGIPVALGTPLISGTAYNSIAVEPFGRYAYAVGTASNTVSQFLISSGQLEATSGTPPAVTGPIKVATDPSGQFVFIATAAGAVNSYPIAQATGALGAQISTQTVTGVTSLTVDPLGDWIIANQTSGPGLSLLTLDAASGTLLSTGQFLAGTITGLAVDPLGRHLYSGAGNTVSVAPITSKATFGATSSTATIASGTILAIAIDPTGSFAFVSSTSQVIFAFSINPQTGALTALVPSIPTGPNVTSLLSESSGQFIFGTSTSSGAEWIYSRSALNPAQLLTVPGTPLSVGASPSSPAVATTLQ